MEFHPRITKRIRILIGDPDRRSYPIRARAREQNPIGHTQRTRSGHIAPTRRSTPSTRSSSETRENATRQSDVSPWPPSRPSTPRSSARVATSRTRARPSLHRPRDRRPCAPPAASPSAPPTVRPEPAPSGSRWDARSNRDDFPRIESRTTPRRRSPPIADQPCNNQTKSPARTSAPLAGVVRRTPPLTSAPPIPRTATATQTLRSPGSCAPRRASPWTAPPPG